MLVAFQVKGVLITAEILTGDEHPQAWWKVITSAPNYAAYQTRTTREIPLILLHASQ